MFKSSILSILFIFILTIGKTQSIDKSDYARAVSFLWENVNNKKAFNLHVVPHWFSDSTGFWYVHFSKNEKTYYMVMFKPLKKSTLFDHVLLADNLGNILQQKIDAKNLELENVNYVNSNQIDFSIKGKKFTWNKSSKSLSEYKEGSEARNLYESKSPDGKWIAYTENYNLFIRSVDSLTIKQLSKRGEENYEYASYYGWSDIMEGEGGDRPKRFSVKWSPDSKWIQTSICDLRFADKMYLLDWSIDTLYRPRLLSYYRGSPGDTTIVYMEPVVFHIETGKEIKLALPRIPYVYGYRFDWSEKPGVAYVGYRERGFQKAHILKFDLNADTWKKIFSDSSKTNIDGFDYWVSEKTGRLIISSERSGWKQLYTLDLKTNLTNPLTTGTYFVNEVLHIDPARDGTVYFIASGKEPGRNPYQQNLYSISLKGTGLKLLTKEDANHEFFESRDGRFVLDNYSSSTDPTTTVLREMKTGKVVMDISKADVSELNAINWTAPQTFTAVGKDGKTIIYGMLWKPTNFDPSKKYPIIDNSYTGPHTHIVPRSFARTISLNNQSLAELGFVVMNVDGLGSSGRSKQFHDYSYKRLGYGLEDHVGAIRQLSKSFSWLDTTRVGIFGHSAGGYDAGRAMLLFPEFYKVAVASSADHDHRMEKAWWPEMYLGWPIDTAYHNQSNITNAAKLKGKLLITHGGIDENVNPSATFKLAEMLVRADKQFDMMIFPSMRHGYTGQQQRYFTKIRWNYFVKHLLNEEPVWDFEWK